MTTSKLSRTGSNRKSPSSLSSSLYQRTTTTTTTAGSTSTTRTNHYAPIQSPPISVSKASKMSSSPPYYSPYPYHYSHAHSSPHYEKMSNETTTFTTRNSTPHNTTSSTSKKLAYDNRTPVSTSINKRILQVNDNDLLLPIDTETLSIIRETIQHQLPMTLYHLADTITQSKDIDLFYSANNEKRQNATIEIENAMKKLTFMKDSFKIQLNNWQEVLQYLNLVFHVVNDKDTDNTISTSNDYNNSSSSSRRGERHHSSIPLGKERNKTPIKRSKIKSHDIHGKMRYHEKLMKFTKNYARKMQSITRSVKENTADKLAILQQMGRSIKPIVSYDNNDDSDKRSNNKNDENHVPLLTDILDKLSLKRIDAVERETRVKQRLESKRIKEEMIKNEQRLEQKAKEAAEAEAAAALKKEQEAKEAASNLLRPLTNEEKDVVNEAIYGSGADSEIVANADNDSVQRKSMRTLRQGCWLNDEVIHYFYLMLSKRDEKMCNSQEGKRRSHFFKSFFLTKLFDEGGTEKYKYSNVKRWSKNVPGKDIFKLDKIFFPCNVNNMHWCCVVVFMQEKRIQFYDSMGSDGIHYLNGLMKYIKDEWKAKKDSEFPDADQWKLVTCEPDTPQQQNGFDCGVFTCMFADFLSFDRPLSFSQKHITQCRERIALSIMKGAAIE